MNLRGIDLNLLVVLDALLDESHVSRAAARVGLSQPAMSSALDRCRHLFDDPLLERADGAMRLSTKAEALREPLRCALAQVEIVLGIAEPTLAETQAEVRIVMADLLGAIIAGPLYRETAKVAPGVNLVLHPWGGGQAALTAAGKGTIDLIVSVLSDVDTRKFHVEPLRAERYLVAMRAGHPASMAFDLDRWLSWPHVVTSAGGGMKHRARRRAGRDGPSAADRRGAAQLSVDPRHAPRHRPDRAGAKPVPGKVRASRAGAARTAGRGAWLHFAARLASATRHARGGAPCRGLDPRDTRRPCRSREYAAIGYSGYG